MTTTNYIFTPTAPGLSEYVMSNGRKPSGKLTDTIPLTRLDVWNLQLSNIINQETDGIKEFNDAKEPFAKQAHNWKVGYGCAFILLAAIAAGVLFVLPKHLDFSTKISNGVAGGMGALAFGGLIITVMKVKSNGRQITAFNENIENYQKDRARAESVKKIVNNEAFPNFLRNRGFHERADTNVGFADLHYWTSYWEIIDEHT